MDQADVSNPIKDIKNELTENSGISNPIKELKSDIDNSVKDINI